MVAVPSPITRSVLDWAIAEDGRSLHELADTLDVPLDELEAWIAGEDSPSRGQVTRLAAALRRPRALFFLPSPPTGAGLPMSFRRPTGTSGNVSPTVLRIGRDSRRIQRAVSWARREQPLLSLPRFDPTTTPPSEAAAVVRTWTTLSIDQQLSWRSDYDAIRGWREFLEQRGVLVFSLQLGRDEVRGFSTWDDRAPLAVVNTSSVAPSARVFTLGHELGHLVTRQDATCLSPDEADPLDGAVIERWCEQFAAALLMPLGLVDQVVEQAGVGPGEATLKTVKLLMRRARVSGRAAALRLISLGWAQQALYAQVIATFVPRTSLASGQPMSPPRYEARLRAYGPEVIRTVFDALPMRDALSVLRIGVPDARLLAAELPDLRVP